MSADPVADIASAVREALAGGPDLCATFTVRGDANKWLQFTDATVNAAYLGASHPHELLAQLGSGTLQSWEAGKFVTVAFSTRDAMAISKWIDRYLQLALHAPVDYSVDVTLEPL